jgi:cell wall-associated NlpC family hydrolase
MLLKRALFLIIAITLLYGCGQPELQSSAKVRELSGSSKTVKLSNTDRVKQLLYAQHQEWRGVRYKDNGFSKKGIDCSGFVHLTFRNRLGKKIPRTTSQLSQLGTRIKRSQLRPGDLVFFKTGIKLRHVGIYVEKGKFLHASTSKGVIISRLDNVYWSKHFWQARRI